MPNQNKNNAGSPDLMSIVHRAHQAYAGGRFNETEFNCRLALSANKRNFEALHLLGLVEFQRGRLDEAYQLLRQALKINPRSAHAHSNLGLILQQLDRLDDALASIDRALAIDKNFLLALNNRGHVLWRLKRPEEALGTLNRALAVKPDYIDALCNRGNALIDLGRLDEALQSYEAALSINPNDAPALNNRANALWALDKREAAMQSYDRALALSPDDLSILKDRGAALSYLRRDEEALECFDRALELKPDDPYFLYARGGALAELNRHEEALACFDQAFALAPRGADALGERANVLSALQRHAEAIASFDRALQLAPESAQMHWNRGLALLRIGDFEQGWKEYEWRLKLETSAAGRRQFAEQRWLEDQPIAGKRILVYSEQGLGDTIQFVRYTPRLAALGAKVILQIQPPLKRLLTSLDGDATILGTDEPLPQFDLHCPLLSLPLAFNTTLDTIPAANPYLSAEGKAVDVWRERLPKSAAPRVGIVWAGNPEFVADRQRSVGLAPLISLFSVPGLQFISLQKELRAGDEELLRQYPNVVHLGDKLEDFSDTAAIMSLLDLVISSDTSSAHLAGALGRPVWILLQQNPDWRWMFDREDNPWYPTARLFRQPTAGDWEAIAGQVVEALRTWQHA